MYDRYAINRRGKRARSWAQQWYYILEHMRRTEEEYIIVLIND